MDTSNVSCTGYSFSACSKVDGVVIKLPFYPAAKAFNK